MEAQRQTFEQLFEDHLKEIQRLIARHTDNLDDRLDLTQEIFVKAYSAFSQFRGDSSPSTWLYKIAINVCANALRSRKRQEKYLVEEPQDFDIPTGLYDVVDELAHKEEQRALKYALRSLSAEQILALSLRFSDQLTIPEIAEVLGTPVDTIKSRLRSALTRIQSAYNYLQMDFTNLGESSTIKVIHEQGLDGVLIEGERGGRIYHNLGSLYLRKGLIEAALQEWRKAQKVAPNFLDAYIASAEQYIAINQPAKAVDTLESAVSKIQNPDLHIELAGLYLDTFRDVDEGIQHSTCAVILEPDNPMAHFTAGWAYREQAKLQEALISSKHGQETVDITVANSWRMSANHLEEAIRLKGIFPVASSLLAINYTQQNMYDAAINLIESTANNAQNDELIQHRAGWIHLRAGKIDAAERYLVRSIESKPTSAALSMLATLLLSKNNNEDAIVVLEQALDLAEDKGEKARIASNLAAAAMRLERLDESIEYAELALHYNPDHVHARCNLAEAHLRRGDNPRIAVNISMEGLQISPDHICFHRILAEAYYRLKKYDDALCEATTAIELEPDVAQRWLLRAKTLVALDRIEEARADITTALELDPKNIEAKTRMEELNKATVEE